MWRKHILSPVSFKQNAVSFQPWLGIRASFMDRWTEQYRGPHTHSALTFIVLKPCLSVVLEISSIFEWEAWPSFALGPELTCLWCCWTCLAASKWEFQTHHPPPFLSSVFSLWAQASHLLCQAWATPVAATVYLSSNFKPLSWGRRAPFPLGCGSHIPIPFQTLLH